MKTPFFIIFIIISHNLTAQLITVYPYGNTEKGNETGVNTTAGTVIGEEVVDTFYATNKIDILNRPAKKMYPPLKKIIPTSYFGWRKHPVTGGYKLHTGVDLKASYEPVYAVADAIVKYAGWANLEGNYIILSHGDVETIYCHLDQLFVAKNEIIKGGQVIGISGNTGRSTGPHLHFGVRFKNEIVNPLKLFEASDL